MPSRASDTIGFSVSRRPSITIWHAALFLPWVVAAVSLRRTFNDNSYMWHVRAGDLQIADGAVITTDPFSYTMLGTPWRTQSWLAELAYSRIDDVAGLDGARVLVTLLAALLFVLLGLIAYRQSRSVISVVLCLVGSAIVIAGFLVPRPVIFSFPLMAAVVLADGDRRLRWGLPLLLWVWASVHGSFAIGLAYLGLRAIGRGLGWRRLFELVFIGLPTLLTAHGLGALEVLMDFFGNREALGYISEWATPELLSFPLLPLFLGILALIWLGMRGNLRLSAWRVVVPFLALAFSANRAVPPAWIGRAPVISRVRLPTPTSPARGPIAATLGGVLLVGPFLLPFETVIDETRFPVEAAKHLETERVFHDDAVGGWLVYTQWPDRLVYIDDRAELFGERIGLFFNLRNARADWREEFAQFGIEEALLRGQDPLTRLLVAEGWRTTYEDEDFVVLRAPT